MAIIQCPECTKQISDQAVSCPHCGAPRAAATVDASQGVVTTQATGKSQKGWQVAGVLAMIVGVIMISSDTPEIGGLLTFGGLVAVVAAKMSAWWQHG